MSAEHNSAEELAVAHWNYVCSVAEKMYKDAFVHGFKHGREASADENLAITDDFEAKNKGVDNARE
jgi:hypothetical protein